MTHEDWQEIAAFRLDGWIGDTTLGRLVRIALALGYDIDAVDVSTTYDSDLGPRITLEADPNARPPLPPLSVTASDVPLTRTTEFECGPCGKFFTSAIALRSHMNSSAHRTDVGRRGRQAPKVPADGSPMPSWREGDPMLVCSVCENWYTNAFSTLQVHSGAVHGRAPTEVERVPVDKAERERRTARRKGQVVF